MYRDNLPNEEIEALRKGLPHLWSWAIAGSAPMPKTGEIQDTHLLRDALQDSSFAELGMLISYLLGRCGVSLQHKGDDHR